MIGSKWFHNCNPPSRKEKCGRTKCALLAINAHLSHNDCSKNTSRRVFCAFVHAATWADDIKRSNNYQRRSIAQDGASATANTGYSDHLVHDYWHYVDLPFSSDGTPGETPQAPNALTQIEAFQQALASNSASDDVKSYDLVWLLHLVGDVHQPLHATSRFSRGMPKGDQGGNKETVCLAFTCGAKLHAYWDGLLGDRGGPSDAEALAATLPSPDATAAIEDPVAWVRESEKLAERFVYVGPIGDGAGPFALTDAYQAEAKRIAERQVALAGARLAGSINAALQ
ncbi:S1/P1 nuclease [Methylosinus sp. Ce-a6]|uniref:S1/P1 nuclease n=1 Tax=Methylosinus sp. Ce-a6 TaxID=2172005 RepID=UPI001FCEFCE7|nr:S1/P1 nuclease [Methylosinus sp. Ce-a6]